MRLAVRRPARHPYACGLRQRCVGPSQSTGAQRDALPALAARHLAAPLATPSRLVRAATPRHARPCSPNPLPRAATPARHGRDMATESAAWRSGAPSPARHAWASVVAQRQRLTSPDKVMHPRPRLGRRPSSAPGHHSSPPTAPNTPWHHLLAWRRSAGRGKMRGRAWVGPRVQVHPRRIEIPRPRCFPATGRRAAVGEMDSLTHRQHGPITPTPPRGGAAQRHSIRARGGAPGVWLGSLPATQRGYIAALCALTA